MFDPVPFGGISRHVSSWGSTIQSISTPPGLAAEGDLGECLLEAIPLTCGYNKVLA